jgi:class 3 adenylate cyclase
MNYTAAEQTTHVVRVKHMTMPGSVLISRESLALAEGYQMVKLEPRPIRGLERRSMSTNVSDPPACARAFRPRAPVA